MLLTIFLNVIDKYDVSVLGSAQTRYKLDTGELYQL